MEKLHTPDEVSESLGVPVKTLYAWRYRGLGPPAMKVGKRLRYSAQDVAEWLEKQKAS